MHNTLFYRNANFNNTNFKENEKTVKFLESKNCSFPPVFKGHCIIGCSEV